MSSNIVHKGIVVRVEGASVTVRVQRSSACSICTAKAAAACVAGNISNSMILEAKIKTTSGIILPGDSVTVSVKSSHGLLAVIIAFIVPLILVVSTVIIITVKLQINEINGGLTGLGAAIAYYSMLYLFRRRLKHSFVVEASPTEQGHTPDRPTDDNAVCVAQ
jgi:sigma-E factor negative regulatory protein RseC